MFKSKWVLPATLSSALVLSILPTTGIHAEAKTSAKEVSYKKELSTSAAYLYKQSLVPTAFSSDTVMAFARSNYGVNKNYYTTYYNEVVKSLKTDGVEKIAAGSLSKTILTLNAIGKNPAKIAGFNLYDEVAKKLSAANAKPLVSDYIYAIIALDSNAQSFSDETKYANANVKILVKELIATQFANGGFSWAQGSEAGISADMTAMALIALSNHSKDASVKKSIDRGLKYMSGQLTPEAGYAPWGGNSADSQAQVILSLIANNKNPKTETAFIKKENWAISNILLNYNKNLGAFTLKPGDTDANLFTTNSGVTGLVAYDRYVNKQDSFYNLYKASSKTLTIDATAPKSVKQAKLTNTSKSISGTTEPFSTVKLYVSNKAVATFETAADGKFTHTLKKPLKASTSVKVYVTDLAGNKSKAIPYKIVDVLTPATPKVSKVVAGAKKVTGTTTKGATVYAKIGSKTYKAVASSKTGKFSIKVPTLKAKTSVKVFAKKGNYTSKSVTVKTK